MASMKVPNIAESMVSLELHDYPASKCRIAAASCRLVQEGEEEPRGTGCAHL
jgi:hypothetical protein